MRFTLWAWLAHPLTLLLVGAAFTAGVTNYLIPSITRQWQDHQREVEIRSSLVGQTSKSVAAVLTAVQIVEVTGGLSQQEFDQAYRQWETERAVIGSQLRAYFPGSKIGPDWDSYSELVTEVYALAGTDDPKFRRDRLARIRTALGGGDGVDWDALFSLKGRSEFKVHQKYLTAWFALKKGILAKKDGLVQSILDSPTALTD